MKIYICENLHLIVVDLSASEGRDGSKNYINFHKCLLVVAFSVFNQDRNCTSKLHRNA